MRLGNLFGRTLREVSGEVELKSHEYLLRAAMIRQVAAGIYDYLPLGWRVLRKIEEIIRQEMDRAGGQEVLMPVVIPAELWQESGRWFAVGPELMRLKDRAGRDMVLGMTHEEAVTDLARRDLDSWRQLPFMLYQIQTKVRDEPRSRGGLLRVREFHMKDAYSFHADHADLDRYYPELYRAYERIFRRCGLDPVAVEADTGMMGGTGSHEFMCLCDAGEDSIMVCPECGYRANLENAAFDPPPFEAEPPVPAEEVATPGTKTIAEVAAFLGVPHAKTLKAVFYTAGGKLYFVIIRGDYEVNEVKLANLLRATDLAMAGDDLLASHGIVAGFASPVGLPAGIDIIADRSVAWGANFVGGANRVDTHLRHVNPGRDFQPTMVADIAAARAGDRCPRCSGRLARRTGIELGHIFKLGTKYSESMRLVYKDAEMAEKLVVMGCYGIGVGRTAAAVIEANCDDKGIIWPMSVAPYHLHLVSLGRPGSEVAAAAEALYRDFVAAGVEVLFDDREEAPGVKFADADLIGCPLRLTVSARSLAKGGVELKGRGSADLEIVAAAEVVALVRGRIAAALEELKEKA